MTQHFNIALFTSDEYIFIQNIIIQNVLFKLRVVRYLYDVLQVLLFNINLYNLFILYLTMWPNQTLIYYVY